MAPKLDFSAWDVGDWTPSNGDIALPHELQKLFLGDEQWPICAASLAALIDLGMSDERIGDYFRVDAHRVKALGLYHGFSTNSTG